METGVFIALMAMGLLAWFWSASLDARELANDAARETCSRRGLQFLDGTVALARLSAARVGGRLVLARDYRFEYSGDGRDRRVGLVILRARRVEAVILEPDPGP